MITGYFGDTIFEVSENRIFNYNDFKRSSSVDAPTHKVRRRKPITEFNAPELDTISMTIDLNAKFGVSPRKEAEKLLLKCREGIAESLIINGKSLGTSKWLIKNLNQDWKNQGKNGAVTSLRLSITFEEYIEELRL